MGASTEVLHIDHDHYVEFGKIIRAAFGRGEPAHFEFAVKTKDGEIRVANLVKEGKTTKEIAALLDSTPRAISFHRQNLRKKLGIHARKEKLSARLINVIK